MAGHWVTVVKLGIFGPCGYLLLCYGTIHRNELFYTSKQNGFVATDEPWLKPSNSRRFFWCRRPEGHVFHTPRQAMIKTYCCTSMKYMVWWRDGDERYGVSYHRPHDCFVNHLFRRGSKKTTKLRVTGLCAGNSPVAGEFPAQMTSNAENVSIWWRHHIELCWLRYICICRHVGKDLPQERMCFCRGCLQLHFMKWRRRKFGNNNCVGDIWRITCFWPNEMIPENPFLIHQIL